MESDIAFKSSCYLVYIQTQMNEKKGVFLKILSAVVITGLFVAVAFMIKMVDERVTYIENDVAEKMTTLMELEENVSEIKKSMEELSVKAGEVEATATEHDRLITELERMINEAKSEIQSASATDTVIE